MGGAHGRQGWPLLVCSTAFLDGNCSVLTQVRPSAAKFAVATLDRVGEICSEGEGQDWQKSASEIPTNASGIGSPVRTQLADFFQRCALVHRDMFGFVAGDLVLRIFRAGVMGVALVIAVLGVDFDDLATDMAGLGVPFDVIADLEFFDHD